MKKTADASPNPTRRKTQLTAEPQPVLVVENISWDLAQKRDSTRRRLLGLNPEAVDKRRGTQPVLRFESRAEPLGPSRCCS